MNSTETVVREGTYLYDEEVECDIRIVRLPIRYGSGDQEDELDVREDLEQETFYVHYGSTTERGVFNSSSGGHPSLGAAIAHAASMSFGPTIRWKSAKKIFHEDDSR